MSSETTTPVTCALCLAVIPANEAEDLYCYGCGEHICERCDETGGGMGHHDADDHQDATDIRDEEDW